jgi:hypothetical protein
MAASSPHVRFAIATVCGMAPLAPATGEVIHVPGDAATIQAALARAAGGDEIVLADGVHAGPVRGADRDGE